MTRACDPPFLPLCLAAADRELDKPSKRLSLGFFRRGPTKRNKSSPEPVAVEPPTVDGMVFLCVCVCVRARARVHVCGVHTGVVHTCVVCTHVFVCVRACALWAHRENGGSKEIRGPIKARLPSHRV